MKKNNARFQIHFLHHWLVSMRGGENVLQELFHLFPEAPLSTLVADVAKLSYPLRGKTITTSVLQMLPGAIRYYPFLLPLFPLATQTLRISNTIKLVFCSDAAVIKGVRIPNNAKMVCYCHTPPRYLWDLREEYARHSSTIGLVGRLLFRASVSYVREFDRRAAKRVDFFIANSKFVQQRIRSCYNRESTVIYPPVDLTSFTPLHHNAENFYLIVSQLVPYKRIDIAVDAFNKLGKRLVVIGFGSEFEALKRRACRNIEFLGSQPKEVLQNYYRRCRAFIFPGVEDFGITPLESMASGRPVIAFAAGGALETIIPQTTGFYFYEQTPEALAAAVCSFEDLKSPPLQTACRARAEQFSPTVFRDRISSFLSNQIGNISDI